MIINSVVKNTSGNNVSSYGSSITVTNSSAIPFLACINGKWVSYNMTVALNNCSELRINNPTGGFNDTTGYYNVEFDFNDPNGRLYVMDNNATVEIIPSGSSN